MKCMKATLYMKSGNAVKFECEKLTVTYQGERITKLEHTNSEPRLLHVDVTQVEAVVEG